MSKLSKEYPHNYSKKQIQDLIESLSEEIMPDSRTSATSQVGADRLLKLGKIQLGINELNSRLSRRVIWFTVIMSILSFLISGTALIFTGYNTRINKNTEDRKYKQDSLMLFELRSISDQIRTKENLRNDTDTIK